MKPRDKFGPCRNTMALQVFKQAMVTAGLNNRDSDESVRVKEKSFLHRYQRNEDGVMVRPREITVNLQYACDNGVSAHSWPPWI